MDYLLQEEHFSVRKAEVSDASLIAELIQALAEYEKAPDQCFATREKIEKTIFSEKSARALIAEYDGKPIGFALYFYNYSTWTARKGLYLEDLFIYPEMRGHGFGKKILKLLARIAKEENCGRFEWVCLDWNAPSIAFYKSLGAKPMDQWTIYRLEEDGIDKLSKE